MWYSGTLYDTNKLVLTEKSKLKKKLLHIEEYTHGGEDTQSNVHAGEVYTRRNITYGENYTLRGVHAGKEEYT